MLDVWKGTDGNRIQVADFHTLWLRLEDRKHAEALDRKLAAFAVKGGPRLAELDGRLPLGTG